MLRSQPSILYEGYRAAGRAPARGSIVVIHEIFGLTPHIRSVCDRLAAAGHNAFAPDLFRAALDGNFLPYTKEGKDRGLAIKNGIGEAALAREVSAAAARLGASGKPAVIGFCLGGTLAWLAAADPAISCAVGYYSVGIRHHLASRPLCPVMMHFGRSDPSIPAADVRSLREVHPAAEVHEYDAGHAFNRDDDTPYHRESAAFAWERSLAFFARHLR